MSLTAFGNHPHHYRASAYQSLTRIGDHPIDIQLCADAIHDGDSDNNLVSQKLGLSFSRHDRAVEVRLGTVRPSSASGGSAPATCRRVRAWKGRCRNGAPALLVDCEYAELVRRLQPIFEHYRATYADIARDLHIFPIAELPDTSITTLGGTDWSGLACPKKESPIFQGPSNTCSVDAVAAGRGPTATDVFLRLEAAASRRGRPREGEVLLRSKTLPWKGDDAVLPLPAQAARCRRGCRNRRRCARRRKRCCRGTRRCSRPRRGR